LKINRYPYNDATARTPSATSLQGLGVSLDNGNNAGGGHSILDRLYHKWYHISYCKHQPLGCGMWWGIRRSRDAGADRIVQAGSERKSTWRSI